MKEVTLDPQQKKAVSELRNGKILCGGVGVGKSRVAMRYYIEKEAPKDVIVITTARKRDSLDWEEEAVKHGIGISDDATLAGVLKVDSWNNLWKYVHVENAFFIFDEQRLVGSGAWVNVFLKIAKKNNWILLSATPGDTWLDYIPVFVANGFYKNRTEFLREHVVYSRYSKYPKVDRFIAVNRLVRLRNSLLVDMPYEKHTTRHLHDIVVEHDETLFKRVVKDRWHVFQDRPIRDVSELFSVMRMVVNSDPSRVTAVKKLMTEHPRLIVFYNFDYELEILRKLASFTQEEKLRASGLMKDRSSSKDTPCPIKDHGRTTAKSSAESKPSNIESTAPTAEQIGRSKTKSSSEKNTGITCSTSEQSENESTSEEEEWNQGKTQSQTDGGRPDKDTDGTTTASSPIQAQPGSMTTSKPVQLAEWNGRPQNNLEEPCQDKTHPPTRTILPTENGLASRHSETKPPIDGLTTAPSSKGQSNSHSIESGVAIAEWNGHKHQPIPDSERWVYLVQYTAGAEAWNCVETDAIVFYSLNYSYRIFEQCQGRIDRRNTPFFDLHYYILKSKADIDKMIWQALRVKKKFNEPRNEDALKALKWA